jgi:hypothetical protein
LALISDIAEQLPKLPKKKFTRNKIEQKANLKGASSIQTKVLGHSL